MGTRIPDSNMTKRFLQLTILALCLVHTTAEGQQTYDFDMTSSMPRYTDSIGYGYDVVDGNQYFSVKVPEGNYQVKVVVGARKHAATTMVKAEDRRLFVDAVSTKKGEFKTFEFTVNRRSPKIDEKQRVATDPRELRGLNWDDKLTLAHFLYHVEQGHTQKVPLTYRPSWHNQGFLLFHILSDMLLSAPFLRSF